MEMYPYNTPIILTDAIFQAYGGQTGSSLAAQRQAAYVGAETLASSVIGTFLLPTTITGTYLYPINPIHPIELRSGFVHSINSVKIFSGKGDCSCDLDSVDGCAYMISDLYGYIKVKPVEGFVYGCGCILFAPFTVEVSYTAGLPSGTSYNPLMLQTLTSMADVLLLDMIDPSSLAGGAGDPGLRSWSDISHSEAYANDGNWNLSVLGSSARMSAAFRRLSVLVPSRYKALRF